MLLFVLYLTTLSAMYWEVLGKGGRSQAIRGIALPFAALFRVILLYLILVYLILKPLTWKIW